MRRIDEVKNGLYKGFFALCALFSLTTCSNNVGLGAKVDTESPTLEIEYPLASEIVKDSFSLKGTWNDDKDVSTVMVAVYDSSRTMIGKPLQANINKDKTWSLVLNKKISDSEYEYPDGTYTVDVYAKDGAGHKSGTASRTFDIDNTAPVFALTSPNSLNVSDPTQFGTVFTIEGEIADDHAIKTLKAWIYDLDGRLKTEQPLQFSNVETTGGTSVVAAQFKSTDETLDANYKAMYDIARPGTEQGFYAVIVVEDEAGNTSTSSYIKSSVINALETKLGIDSTNTVGLKSTDIKKIINGTFNINETSATVKNVSLDELRNIIKGCEISPFDCDAVPEVEGRAVVADIPLIPNFNKDKCSYVTFTLNSNANPTYEVVGYSFTDPASIEETGSGSSLNIKIQTGLNGYKVNPKIKAELWAVDPNFEKMGKRPYAVVEGSKRTLYDIDSEEEVVKSSETGVFIKNSSGVSVDNLSTTVATATYILNLPTLSARKVYIVEISGTDEKNQPLDSSEKYAFKVSASGRAAVPSFGLTNGNENLAPLSVTNAHALLKFSGTVRTDTALATIENSNAGEYCYWEIKATNESTGSLDYTWKGKIDFEDETVFTENLDSAEEYKWTVSSVSENLLEGSDAYSELVEVLESGACYLFEFTAEFVNGSDSARSLSRSIHIDTKKPELKITSVTPTVTNQVDESKPKINGIVNLTGQITETNMKELHYKVELTDEAIANVTAVTESVLGPGNGIVLRNPVWRNDVAYENDPVTYADYNPETKNLAVNLKIDTVRLVSGILTGMGYSGENLELAKMLFDHIESELRFVAWAVDAAGNTSDPITQSYIFAQMTDTPGITLTNATSNSSGDVTPTKSKNMFGTTSNRNLIGTVTDDDGLKTVTIKYRKWGTEDEFVDGEYELSAGTTSTSVNFQLPDEEGEYEVEIFAEDNKAETVYNKDKRTYHIAVDSGEPKLKIITTQDSDASQNSTFTVTGTVSDGSDVRLYRVEVLTNKDGEGNILNAVGIGDASQIAINADGSWSDTIRTGLNGDTVKYRAIDKYDYSSEEIFTYSIDSIKPEVSVTSLKSDDEIYEINPNYKTKSNFALSGNKLAYGESENSGNFITITGRWSDKKLVGEDEIDGSGTKELQYNTVSPDAANEQWITVGGTAPAYKAGAIWSFDLPIEEGSMNLYVRATDEASNVSSVVSIENLKIDFQKPAFSEQSVVSSTGSLRTSSDRNTADYCFVKMGETITISGKVSDSYGIAEIVPSIKLEGTEISAENYAANGITFATSPADYAGKTNVDYSIMVAGNSVNNGKLTVDMIATDRSGRDSKASSKENVVPFEAVGMIVDTVAPVWAPLNETYPFKVGGKSNPETSWFNNTSLKINGFYEEATSGVDVIYALVVSPENLATAPSTVAGVKAAGGTVSFTAKAAGNFETTLDGFAENSGASANRLLLVAEDKAGNTSSVASASISLDLNAPAFTSSYITYDDVTFNSASGSVLTNARKNIKIYGSISDTASGTASLDFTVNDNAVTPVSIKYSKDTVSTESEYKNAAWEDYDAANSALYRAWEAEIAYTDIRTGSVKVTPKDTAGNGVEQQIFSFNRDIVPPSVNYAAFKDADTAVSGTQINGSIVLSGTATDDQQLSAVTKIQYQVLSNEGSSVSGDPSDWTTLETSITGSAYSWSTGEIDTTELFPASLSGNVYVVFRAVVTDAAGNDTAHSISGANLVDVTGDVTPVAYVNQNSDRPTVKISNLNGNRSTLMYGDNSSITGNVSDDDATAVKVSENFVVTSSRITSLAGVDVVSGTGSAMTFDVKKVDEEGFQLSLAPKAGTIVSKYPHIDGGNTYYDVTIFDPLTGDWTFYPWNVSDDTKTMYFYVEDNNSNVFYSGNSSSLKKPYIQFKSNDRLADNDPYVDSISYTSDSSSPAITSTRLEYSKTGSGAADGSFETLGTSTFVGADRKFIRFVVNCYDASGIEKVAVVLTEASSPESAAVKTETFDSSAGTGALSASGQNGTFTSDYFDISEWRSGSATAVVTVTDGSHLYNNATLTFSIDNDEPDVTISAPGQNPDTDVVTSTTKVVGTFVDGGSGVKEAWWKISKTEPAASTRPSAGNENGWTKLESVTSADIDFNSTDSGDAMNILKYANSTYAEETFEGSNIYKVPVWYYVVDNVGNETITTNSSGARFVFVDPDAGRPTTKILYPGSNATIGGLISVIGKADDDLSVKEVYVQLGSVSGETFTPFTAAQYTALGMAPITGTGTFAGHTYVKATGTNSWSIDVDTTIFNGNNRDTTNFSTAVTKLGVKTCALDYDGKTRSFSSIVGDTYIQTGIDQEIPGVTNLRLVQYKNTAGGEIEREKAYVSGMYISHKIGNKVWYLEGEAEDDVGKATGELGEVLFTNASGTYTLAGSASANGANIGYKQISSGSDKKWKFWAKLPTTETSGSGLFYTQLSVSDNASPKHTNTQYISINIDNTAPALYDTSDAAVTTSTAALRLKLNNDEGRNINDDTNVVVNSNSSFTLGDTVTETDSGMAYIAFYFERDSATNGNRVYNPMFESGNRTNLAAKPATPVNENVYINDDGLACIYMTDSNGAARASTTTFTNAAIGANNSIRSGGIIKIGGMYTRFTKSGNTLTLAEPVDTSFTAAEVILAQVVDRTGTESADDGTVSDTADGDGMVESYLTSSGKWYASVDSSNIPDGPVKITVVAIDKAGNISKGSVDSSIQNHRPRLAKIMLGTDLNGNGTYDYDASTDPTNSHDAQSKAYGEFNFYSCLDENDKAQAEVALTETVNFKVKSGMALIPEFTGGNSGLKYTYQISAAAPATVKTTGTTVAAAGYAEPGKLNTMYTKADLTTGDSAKLSKKGEAELSGIVSDFGGIILGGTTQLGADGDKHFAFTFWDETEETVQGSSSQYATLTFPVVIDEVDEVSPIAVINPFYWKSAAENSLYGNSKANGHIELEDDLPETFTADGTGVNDRDPKVSGKIVLTGTVYDDVRLSKINLAATGFFNETTLATYSSATGSWTRAATLPNGVLEFNVYNDSLTQDGHSATWSMALNTALLKNDALNAAAVAGTDKAITVTAYDCRDIGTPFKGNHNTPGTTQTEASKDDSDKAIEVTVNTTDVVLGTTAYYKVDVVPYITKISTGIESSAGEEFARSATGKYIVRANENVKLYGFNLDHATLTKNAVTINGTTVTPTAGDSATYITIPVGNTAVSGKLELTVNSVKALNNSNSNPTFKSSSDDEITNYAYNSQANGTTNNRLTDDVELWIWGMGNFVDNTKITSPMMKMDAASNWYMSYGKGIQNMEVNVNGTETSVDYSYNKFHNTNVTFDSNGSIYAVAMNTDRIHNDSSRFVLYTPSTADGKVPATVNGTNTSYVASSNSKRHLELAYNAETEVYNNTRVKDSKIVTYRNGNNTYIGIAYYDGNNTINPIKFRYGTRNGNTISGGITGQIGNGVTSSSSRPTITMTQSNNPSTTDSSASGYHIVSADTYANGTTPMTYKGGAYAACGLVPVTRNGTVYTGAAGQTFNNCVAVMAWYDASVRKICYSYNAAPDNAVVGGAWQTNAKYLDDEYTGWYVDMKVDAAGGIHIAYYNSAKGDLKYVYLSRYDAEPTEPVTIDSYLSVGTNITVDVRNDGTAQSPVYVPYIYYYNSSANQTPNSVKVAWRSDMESLRDGAINDKFTGAWESMTIPTANIPSEATVCGGVPTSGTWGGSVVLGYMTDRYYERANLKK